ncbi:MAG: hypothetical protein KW788_04380 [Candidatus Doudnabacteria bacterium]|nr:hypothetical protein [Candidatus Doudnabacteria bacterium]
MSGALIRDARTRDCRGSGSGTKTCVSAESWDRGPNNITVLILQDRSVVRQDLYDAGRVEVKVAIGIFGCGGFSYISKKRRSAYKRGGVIQGLSAAWDKQEYDKQY